MLYTAVGNCLTAGAGGLLVTTGYPVHIRNMLAVALGEPVELRNYGKLTGMYTWELLDRLQHDPQLREDLRNSEFITFNVGENELLAAARELEKGRVTDMEAVLARHRQVYPQMIRALLELVPRGQAAIRTMNTYNPFPGHRFERYLYAFHAVQRHGCSHRNGLGRTIPVADVHALFSPGRLRRYLGADGVHPSWLGHRMIARAIFSLGLGKV